MDAVAVDRVDSKERRDAEPAFGREPLDAAGVVAERVQERPRAEPGPVVRLAFADEAVTDLYHLRDLFLDRHRVAE